MEVLFLHIGSEKSGIYQYGKSLVSRMLSLPASSDLRFVEESIQFGFENFEYDVSQLKIAIESHPNAKVLHLQLAAGTSRHNWGEYWQRQAYLQYLYSLWRESMVITFHDLSLLPKAPYSGPLLKLLPLNILLFLLKHMIKVLTIFGLKKLSRMTAKSEFLVNFLRIREQDPVITLFYKHELESYSHLLNVHKTVLLPHFCERKFDQVSYEIPKLLNRHVQGVQSIVLMGYIFNRKGYEFLFEALQYVKMPFHVYLCGEPSPRCQEYLDKLLEIALKLGFSQQVTVTGFLSPDEQLAALRDADLVVCPYLDNYSASGTIPLVLSTNCPLLTSKIRLTDEMISNFPNLFQQTDIYKPLEFAFSIEKLLSSGKNCIDFEVRSRFCEETHIDRVCSSMIEIYKGLASNQNPKRF